MCLRQLLVFILVVSFAIAMGPAIVQASIAPTQVDAPAGVVSPASQAAVVATLTVDSTGKGGDNNLSDGVCDGDPTAPGPQCTFLAALQNANANPGHDVIHFHSAITYIALGPSERILEAVTIDGSVNGGYVTIDGANASGPDAQIFDPTAISVHAGNSVIRGLNIINFRTAIKLIVNGGNVVENNRIGTDVTGTQAHPNGNGILVLSDHNTIRNNLISGNSTGIVILGNNAHHNDVHANRIGTNAGGGAALPNTQAGVSISDALTNTVGSLVDPGLGNVISGNGSHGVEIVQRNAPAFDNVIAANVIGLNAAGTAPIPNGGNGVHISSASNNVVGGAGPGRNVISGNGGHGVAANAVRNVLIQGNYIGTNLSGTAAIGNGGDGVVVSSNGDGTGNLVGGSAGLGNVISGNSGNGVTVGMHNMVVRGNIIGANANGTAAIPNGGDGVRVGLNNNNQIRDNLVSGNGQNGVNIAGFLGGPAGNVIAGNTVGVNAAATAALPNGGNGVVVNDARNNVVGGVNPGDGNVIAGNAGHGIFLSGPNAGGNRIEGNWIGTDPSGSADLGNSGDGVRNSTGTLTIGGTTAGAGNVIAFNAGAGVAVTGSGSRNLISSNTFHDNGGLAIDLGADGVTLNDLGDVDQGANTLLNFPVLTAVTSGTPTIDGVYFGGGNKPLRLEFFASPACDPSDHGEGSIFLGSTTITMTGGGPVPFTASFGTPVPDGYAITATATDISPVFGNPDNPRNDTSEFSHCLPVPTAASNEAYWVNPAGGYWNDPNNWSPALVPDASKNVHIELPGTYTVTLVQNVNVSVNVIAASLTLGGASGVQTLDDGGKNITLNGASTVGSQGRLIHRNGTLTLNSDLTVDGSFDWHNGTVSGSGGLEVNGQWNWFGGVLSSGGGPVTVSSGGAMNLSGAATKSIVGRTVTHAASSTWTGSGVLSLSGVTFSNSGSIGWSGGNINAGGGTIFDNEPGALFDIRTDTTLGSFIGGNRTFNNAGTLRKSAGSGKTIVGYLLNNNGQIEIVSGTVQFTNTFNQLDGLIDLAAGSTLQSNVTIQGGVLKGEGTVSGHVVNSGGQVSPGSPAGTLTINGNYTQQAGASLNVEIGGPAAGSEYDRLQISGSASLNGRLNLSLLGGYSPIPGDTFQPLIFGSRSGQFATVNGTDLGGGKSFNVLYNAQDVTLETFGVNPPPVLLSVDPTVVGANGPDFILTLSGADFLPGAQVQWNGTPRATTVVSSTQATALIPAADLASSVDVTTALVTIVNPAPGGGPSAPRPVAIVSNIVERAESAHVAAGETASVAALPSASGEAGLASTLANNGGEGATLTVATYTENPGTPDIIDVGGGFVDLQATGVDAGDSVAARFYYPSTVTATDETALQLQYFTGSGWAPVRSSGDTDPVKETTDNLDGTISGGRFSVTFDATSTPAITDLTGTVFAPAVLDATPPQIVPTVDPAPNAAGWHNGDVTVTWVVADPESGIAASSGCETTQVTAETAGLALTCTATNGAGRAQSAEVTIRIDRTAPDITIDTPQAQAYLHTDAFNVTWIASDGLSGLAFESGMLDGSAVTNGQTADLFFLSLGAHTVVITATDVAGNVADASVAFSVVADINSLIAATERACQLGWISAADVCAGLLDKLNAARAAIERGQSKAARNQLNAFLNQLDAQRGKAVNQQAYDLLTTDARYVIGTL